MFLLFFNLYLAMFTGYWQQYTWNDIVSGNKQLLNGLGTFLTSIFGDNQMTTLGDVLMQGQYLNSYISCLCLILATITSIGIVVVATKGIKKIFTVFFYGVR